MIPKDRLLTLWTLVCVFYLRISLTWALTICETALIALVPLFIGFAIDGALLRKSRLRHDCPFLLWHQATRTISAVPRAEKRFMSATRIWISAVWLSGCLAAMRSPKAFKHRIFASIRLRTWYPVQRFQNALP
jgi:hypothetical protein